MLRVLSREGGVLADLPPAWRETVRQFMQYVVVGGLAFVVDFFTLKLLLQSGAPYLMATTAAFLLGLVVCFSLSVLWVWRGTQARGARDFLLFSLIGVAGLGITVLGMWIGVDVLHFDPLHSKLALAAIVLAWNFTLRKFFVFFR